MGCCLPKKEKSQTNSKMSGNPNSLEGVLGANLKPKEGENKKPKLEPKVAKIQPNPSTQGPSDEIDEPDAPPNQGPRKITDLGLLQVSEGLTDVTIIRKLFLELKLDDSQISQKSTDVAGFAKEVTMAVYKLLVKWKNKEALKTEEINLCTLKQAMVSIHKSDLIEGVKDLEESTLMNIAEKIGETDVNMLALMLGISNEEVTVILSNEGMLSSIKLVAHGLFMIWKSQVAKKSEEEKIDILKKALNFIGKPDLINRHS